MTFDQIAQQCRNTLRQFADLGASNVFDLVGDMFSIDFVEFDLRAVMPPAPAPRRSRPLHRASFPWHSKVEAFC
ncbi:MAG: hypothetical protein QM739_14440 [Propionivibrio sp.]